MNKSLFSFFGRYKHSDQKISNCLLRKIFETDRDVKVVRPIYGVELFDGETARFEVEISEDDVHGEWKLKGDVLRPSSVRRCSPREQKPPLDSTLMSV